MHWRVLVGPGSFMAQPFITQGQSMRGASPCVFLPAGLFQGTVPELPKHCSSDIASQTAPNTHSPRPCRNSCAGAGMVQRPSVIPPRTRHHHGGDRQGIYCIALPLPPSFLDIRPNASAYHHAPFGTMRGGPNASSGEKKTSPLAGSGVPETPSPWPQAGAAPESDCMHT